MDHVQKPEMETEPLRLLPTADCPFQQFFAHAPVAIAMFDTKMRFVLHTHEWLRLHGFEEQTLLGRSFYEVFPEAPEHWKEIHQRCLNGAVERGRRDRLTGSGRNGDWFSWEIRPWLRADGQIGGIIASSAKVNEEVRLRRNLDLYKDSGENIPIGIYVYHLADAEDDRSLRIIYANPAAERLTGMPNGDVVGKSIDEAFPGLRIHGIPAELSRIVQSKEALDFPDLKYGDGRVREAIWKFKAYPLSGACVGVAFEDVSKVRAFEANVAQAQRMEVLGKMAGGVAHDFKNILAAIQGFSELVQTGVNLPESLEGLNKATEKANKIVEKLMAFAHEGPTLQTVFDLNLVVEEALDIIRALVGGRVQVSFERRVAPAWIKADPDEILQTLMNLASNAADAMTGEGSLVLRTSSTALDRRTAHFGLVAEAGDYIAMEVQDTGSGIEKDTLEHIFEPFFTTKAKGAGTGLGLPGVYKIVGRSGGLIQVESAPGQGATFRMFWPTAPIPERPAAPSLSLLVCRTPSRSGR